MNPRILFVQPDVGPPGGAAGVAAWMLDHLAARYQVTLLTGRPFDPAVNDQHYGTSLTGRSLETVLIDGFLLRLLERFPNFASLLKIHLVMRAGRRLARERNFDLICSAFNEVDFGQPCVEYIHYPWNLYPRPGAPQGGVKSSLLGPVAKLYNWGCCRLSGFRSVSRPANLTLVNSAWTGAKFRQRYPVADFHVLHPPALSRALDDDRSRRRADFLSIGRLCPSKEWFKLIDIVSALRQRGHDVGLTLAGSHDNVEFEKALRQRIADAGDWLRLVKDFSHRELEELMLTHDYGLHGMRDEHYGMAVAELLLGGCLTMVPDDGGQIEIVTDPRMQYSSVASAVGKWDKVLRDPALKSELLAGQQARRATLTRERFLQEFGDLVQSRLKAPLSVVPTA